MDKEYWKMVSDEILWLVTLGAVFPYVAEAASDWLRKRKSH